jgi:hypothetical protein
MSSASAPASGAVSSSPSRLRPPTAHTPAAAATSTAEISRASPGASFGVCCALEGVAEEGGPEGGGAVVSGRVVRVVRVVSLLTQAAAASGLMVGDQIRSVNGAALGGGADAMRRFCAEANSTSKTLAVEFTRPPRPRGAALVGRIFRLPAQKVRFIVTAFTETTRQHRVLFYGPRAPLCLSDDDWSSVAALCAHFGERPVPMDARAAHVSITVVGRGGVMHRAGTLPGLCSLSPTTGNIVVELPQSSGGGGGGGRFYATCKPGSKTPALLQSQRMLALTCDCGDSRSRSSSAVSFSRRQLCLLFASVESCEVFCAFARAQTFPVHRMASLPCGRVPAANLSSV